MTRTSLLRAGCAAALLLVGGLPAAGPARAQDQARVDAAPATRWSGSGSLQRVGAQRSADQRFALEAVLQKPSYPTPSDASLRFALSAQLAAAKGLPGSCAAGPDGVFRDGFE